MGHLLASAHDMAREHKIISAVGKSNVPVPRTLGVCEDISVNDAPFYVMSFIEGVVLDSPDKGLLLAEEKRRPTSEHLIDVLADLHAVDIDAVGLGDLAKRDGYIERQLKRWGGQWEQSKTRELPVIDEVTRLLASQVPQQVGSTIAHGDYRFGNCLVDIDASRVVGVLDWELCTLGDPLADLGYIGVYWTDPGHEFRKDNDPSGHVGYPTYAELVERYAAKSGRDVSQIGYYVAFSNWRLAIISEGVYRRYRDGNMGDDGYNPEPFRAIVEVVADAAMKALKSGI
jgi:aminoglycoside phosphotransferase (APT) family kinase protein